MTQFFNVGTPKIYTFFSTKIFRLFLFCYFSWKDTSLGSIVMKTPLEGVLTVGNRRQISLCFTWYQFILCIKLEPSLADIDFLKLF